MDALDLNNKRVLLRQDLNVPLHDGHITNDARLRAAVPTLKKAIKSNARVIVMSHLGRPQEGQYDPQYSLQPVAARLSELLSQPVKLIRDINSDISVAPGEIVLLENVRFLVGEKSNADQLAQQLANLCDIFVMDAFGTAHRAHASTYGVARYAPLACAGPLLITEIDTLTKAISNAKSPLLAIVGGAKVSSKLGIL